MRALRRSGVILAALAVTTSVAAAQTRKAEPQGVTLAGSIKPDKGFLDDVFVFDGSGARVAVVMTDAGSFAEIAIYNVSDRKPIARFDVSSSTTNVTSLAFVGGGEQLFVVGRPTDEGDATGHVFDFSGKVIRKFGPGTDVVLTYVNGEQAVTVFQKKPGKKGGMDYTITVSKLETGKAIGKKRTLSADQDGFVKSIDMTIQYWRNGYTQLVGKKKGGYDKIKDQRMNDGEGVWDTLGWSLLRNTPVNDVIEYTKLLGVRVEHQNESIFVHVPEDMKGVELVTPDNRRVPVKLAEQFYMYDPKSLVYELGRDGKFYFTLTIDPANPEAVNKKKMDPEVIDLYVLDPGAAEANATRVARLPKNERRFTWHHAGGTWAVLRKHKGFGRGGQELELYTLSAK